MATDTHSLLMWLLGGGLVVLALLGAVVAMRGRRIAGEHVFQASRWSRARPRRPSN